ncbi:MAG: tetratricopeptide repeat protein [Deltaproteobacteria bacterium]|nr:tetratricopeptide repeat protein [Deltaproteobacteria bacterium]
MKRNPAIPFYRFIVAIFLSSVYGCWTSASAGEKLRVAGQKNDERITQLESTTQSDREQLSQRLANLEQVLEQSRNVLTRDSADRGAQVDQLQEKIARLEGQMAELQHGIEVQLDKITNQNNELRQRVDQIARKAGIDMPVAASEIPQDKQAHYQAAYGAFKASEFSKARALFREYLSRYPSDEKADDAQYWIGTSYLSENKPATALGEFRKVIDEYGKGNAVEVALFGMAEAFFKLHACTDAKAALEALIKKRPTKKLLDIAKEKLREVKKADSSYCTS